jgi:hypothetical protein
LLARRTSWPREGLKEMGFVEGQNVAVEYRYADNQLDQLPTLVAGFLEYSKEQNPSCQLESDHRHLPSDAGG